MNMLISCDPTITNHIFGKNFSNYPKGPEFRKIFEILGDGIFNADFELWDFHRRTTLAFVGNSDFYNLLENTVWEKVQNGLVPVLDYFSEHRTDFDLQDIFHSLTFDNICKLVLDYDPCSFSIDLPNVPCEKAFSLAVDALFRRHILPEPIWKLQKWLKIGSEKKLIQAWNAFDEFIYSIVEPDQKDDRKLLTAIKKAFVEKQGLDDFLGLREFLRDTSLNLMFAGRDTTSTSLTWLFWLIAMNPLTEIKIREEIEETLQFEARKWSFSV